MSTRSNHVVFGHNSLRCLNCGEEMPFQTPIGINSLVGLTDGFAKDHEFHTEQTEKARRRFVFATADEWRQCWDTGISSATIWSAILKRPTFFSRFGVPHDPDDFSRCYRLVDKLGWRDRLPEVAAAHPEWAPFVEAWDILVGLYKEEESQGTAPKLYAYLKGLAQSADGSLRG